MKSSNSQNLQIKLSLDQGLKKTWQLLAQEYQALDKASIIRLALNNLAKETKIRMEKIERELFQYLDEVENRKDGMTEEEFFKWWNKNKPI